LPGIWNPFLEDAYKPRTGGPIADGCFRTLGRTMVMSERPEPDMDHVREAMRDHDEREHEEHEEREQDEAEREEQEDAERGDE
jgi:hypothetical protein